MEQIREYVTHRWFRMLSLSQTQRETVKGFWRLISPQPPSPLCRLRELRANVKCEEGEEESGFSWRVCVFVSVCMTTEDGRTTDRDLDTDKAR